MSGSRDIFLERVRRAVEAGNRVGTTSPLPAPGTAGYQGAGPDPVRRFCERLSAVGGHAHPVADSKAAIARLLELVQSKAAKRVVLGRDDFLDSLNLPDHLAARGIQVIPVDKLSPETSRDPLFAADLGISGAATLIAETGTIVVRACTEEPRSLSLLPPVHVVVAEQSRLLPDLFDLFEPKRQGEPVQMPSCLSLITGPSKTGDIELRLVTGVHGPGEVHVIVVTS
jgi:L-lactate dehydrogenase complex protein LldG